MTKKLEKTYREMLKEDVLDEAKQSSQGKKHTDDDPKVDAEDQAKQKKGVEPEKPKDVANRKADDSKKGLAEAKKMKKEEEEKDDLEEGEDKKAEDEDEIEESKETPAERVERGVPAKKDKLEEAKKVSEEEDGAEDDEELEEAEDKEADEIAESLEADLAESTSKAVSEMGDLLESQGSLEEDHKDQVKTLFEAALADKTKAIRTSLEEQHEIKLASAIAESEELVVESLDKYLDKVVAEWIEENAIALESSIRTEITESFLGAMKDVFEDHYVDVPDEKLDLVENILDENEEMEAKLNKSSEDLMEANAKLASYKKSEVIETLSEGLTMTEKERLEALTEEVDYSDAESFTKKAQTIKEGFIKQGTSNDELEILNEGEHGSDESESLVAKRYGKALSSMSVDKFDMRSTRSDK